MLLTDTRWKNVNVVKKEEINWRNFVKRRKVIVEIVGVSECKRSGIDNGCKTEWTKWTFKNKANEQKQIYIL